MDLEKARDTYNVGDVIIEDKYEYSDDDNKNDGHTGWD